jgi:asparagine synthase (glutamine-hydrolysing)
MCGIFGLFLNRPLTEADVALGRAGTVALTHRGPDGEGEWIDGERGVFLGHRRLSIIDLTEASAQPMERGGSVIAYNGEIYNFRDLRSELEGKGVDFRSSGDAEVLLQAWREWGERALDRFDGMFAFSIWDGEKAHFAVDPFGEKPLFWAETTDGVYVSSELKPLVDLLDLKPSISDELAAALHSISSSQTNAICISYGSLQWSGRSM